MKVKASPANFYDTECHLSALFQILKTAAKAARLAGHEIDRVNEGLVDPS